MTENDFHVFADSLLDIILLIGEDGAVSDANRAAVTALGEGSALKGTRFCDLVAEDGAAALDYVRRCSGSRAPLVGILSLRGREGAAIIFTASGAQMPGRIEGRRVVLLRLAPRAEAIERFSLLGRRLDALSQENRLRRVAERDLRRLNDTLEARVAERTRALDEANDRLTREIAERRRAEEALGHMLKMEALGQLTGGIAHDFNNLLTVIIGALNLLEERSGRKDLKQVARSALRAAERGSLLTRQLLAFSRKQLLHPQLLDFNEVVTRMAALLARTLGSNVAIELHCSPDLWHSISDPAQLETTLLNLVFNARDAMPEGGKLTLATSNVTLAREGDAPGGDFVRLEVTDNGAGIPPEIIDRVFEPFFTTKEVGKGTGLGLSQVYGFVTQSGGRVAIKSAPGQGTTVVLDLPRGQWRVRERAKIERVAPAVRPSCILVVEDDTDVRDLVVFVLSDLGYEVRQAGDGEEALMILDQESGIDLLFTDIGLPRGMDGIALAEAAKQRRPDLKLLFTSGYAAKALQNERKLEGAILNKPFRASELAREIGSALNQEDVLRKINFAAP